MARILITGATGTVGHAIAARLSAEGHQVRALTRDPVRARDLLPAGVEAVAGDVCDAPSVRAAIEGCSVVYHAAGLPEQWRRDPADFERVNVDGTRNLVDAALAHGCERFVYTSTIDIFAWTPGEPFDESVIDPDPRPTHYERSKQQADRIVTEALERGLDAVFLHPSGVYGPAPVLAAGLNDLLARLALRKVPMLLPGGMPVVCAADVAEGHLLAAALASVGERFILSEESHSLVEIARTVARHADRAKVPPVMPIAVARAVSAIGERVARVTRKAPLIPRGALHFLESDARPVAARASERLGWTATGFDEGVGVTLSHFRDSGWIGA